VRLDESTPGSGLGLAIVQDLAQLYGGALALEECAGGGLRARLELPGSP
jgi:signal transduction histidine kinase